MKNRTGRKSHPGMSRRTSWTLILCAVVVGLALPIGAYGAAGTVFNLSDASKTGPDGDARILNNKLGTTLCDVRTTGVTTANCVKVSAGRLLTLDREPPNLFAVGCFVGLLNGDSVGDCRLHVPAKFVIESVTVSGYHGHGVDMFACRILVPQGPSGPVHPMEIPLDWVGSDGSTAYFSATRSVRVHGARLASGEGLFVECRRAPGGTQGDIDINIAGYSY